MAKQTQTQTRLEKPKRKRKGIHSKNNKPPKKYRGQGKWLNTTTTSMEPTYIVTDPGDEDRCIYSNDYLDFTDDEWARRLLALRQHRFSRGS